MTFIYDPWAWRDAAWFDGPPTLTNEAELTDTTRRGSANLEGYDVQATDGKIGSIDEASHDVDGAHVVVDTGPWIFGRKVLLPAGTIESIDHIDRKVFVDRTKEQIKDSPEYDPDTFGKPEYRDQVGGYYEQTYRNIPPVG